MLPEGPGLQVSYAFVRSRDVNLCFTSKSLFPLLETPSFLKIPNMSFYPNQRLKSVTDLRSEQLIQIRPKEKEKGVKTDSCGLPSIHADRKSLTTECGCALRLFSIAHFYYLLTPLLLFIGTGHLLVPSLLPRRPAWCLFSLMQHISIWIIPYVCRAPALVKYEFPISDHDSSLHMAIGNLWWGSVSVNTPSTVSCTNVCPS